MGNLVKNVALTGRQLEVMELISKGFSNSEIANSLGITHNTVKIHVAKIFERLEVSNRAEASALFGRINGDTPKQDVERSPSSFRPRMHVTLHSSNEIGKIEARWLKKFSKYLSSWEFINLHVPVLNNSGMPRINTHSDYVIEFEKHSDGDLSEFSWHIKYYDQERNAFRDVQSFERTQANLNTSTLIDVTTLIFKQLIKDISQLENLPTEVLRRGRDFCSALDMFYQHDPSLHSNIIEVCDKLIERRPKWPTAYAIKALTLYRMFMRSQIEASNQTFDEIAYLAKKSYSLDVKSAWTHTAFGHHCLINQSLDLAEKHFESALALNPSFYTASEILVQVYSFQGKFDQALSLIDSLFDNHSDIQTISNVYQSQAIVKYCANDLDGCKTACKNALMYSGANQLLVIMIHLSVSERLGDKKAVKRHIALFESAVSEFNDWETVITYAKSLVPEKTFKLFSDSLIRSGLNIDMFSAALN